MVSFSPVTDARITGSLGDLAAVPGVPSEPTLRKLIRENPDFPVVSTGTNGHAYEIDIAEAIAWLRSHEEKRREAERARSAEVRQFALDLLGPDAASQPREGLSIGERKQLLEEELIATKLAEKRRELVRKDAVEAAFSAVFDLLSEQRRTLAARLAKRTDLSRRQQTLIDEFMEADLHLLATRFEEMGRSGAVPDGTFDTGV